MWLRTSCTLEFEAAAATPFLLMLRPQSGAQQWVAREEYLLRPSVQVREFVDLFGNLCQRLMAPAGLFTIKTSADVEVSDGLDTAYHAPFVEVQQLPEKALPFLLPSRYCESDRLGNLATSITAHLMPGYDQCAGIVDYIQRTLAYVPGTGQEIISSLEVMERHQAVCRDMAHLGIALCRSLCIPARLVVGYLEGLTPMDLHAWFEAFVGDRWYTFDPTQNDLLAGRVAIAYGRDAADVAIYNQFGDPVELQQIHVSVERLDYSPW